MSVSLHNQPDDNNNNLIIAAHAYDWVIPATLGSYEQSIKENTRISNLKSFPKQWVPGGVPVLLGGAPPVISCASFPATAICYPFNPVKPFSCSSTAKLWPLLQKPFLVDGTHAVSLLELSSSSGRNPS